VSQFIYHAAAVPMRYADRVQQESTLFPIAGWPKKPLRVARLSLDDRKKQIVAKAYYLQKLWRERVVELGDAGWDLVGNTPKGLRDRGWAQRCRPTFFIPKGATGFRANDAPGKESFRCCQRIPICPFCYARWVREMWLRVDYTLFRDPDAVGRATTDRDAVQQRLEAAGRTGRARGLDISGRDPNDPLDTEDPEDPCARILPRNTGVDLIWWREQQLVNLDTVSELAATHQVPKDIRGRRASAIAATQLPGTALQQELASLTRWEWPAIQRHRDPQKYHAALGGLQSLVVEPYTLEKKRKFRITIRRLLIMPHGAISDNRQVTLAKQVTAEMKTIVQPSRKDVAAEMARLLRYPTGLLRGDVPLTVEALMAPQPPAGVAHVRSMKLNSTFGTLRDAVAKMKAAGIK